VCRDSPGASAAAGAKCDVYACAKCAGTHRGHEWRRGQSVMSTLVPSVQGLTGGRSGDGGEV